MKMKFYNSLLLTFIFVALSFSADAQTRYLDEVFTGFTKTADITYASNISILTGAPSVNELKMDVYQPAGDTETERPLVIVLHTGSFLPALFNGGITGDKKDSAVVETCRRLARRGYVAAAISYRKGWIPQSMDQNTRTRTLLQAAFRGIQDTRSAVRYFRRDVAEASNTFGIDADKVTLWGLGTGGYMSLGAGILDEWEEVTLDKFVDSETLLPYIDSTVIGNLYGTTTHQLCLANHPGYSSDVDFAVNMGGAMGDSTWLDGTDNEPAIAGVHLLKDPFAPFHFGAVIVPTTMQFVVNVSGTHQVVDRANRLGNNDVFNDIPAANDPLAAIINLMKNVNVTLPTGATIPLAVDNMYPFVTDGLGAGPWDWWDKGTLDLVVAGTNAALGTNFSSDTLHLTGQIFNPGMSAAKGKAYLDTTFLLMIPRMCASMELGCFTSGLEVVKADEVSLKFSPNPATDQINIKTSFDHPMDGIRMYDMQGRMVLQHVRLNTSEFNFSVTHLTPGNYVLTTLFKNSMVSELVIIQ